MPKTPKATTINGIAKNLFTMVISFSEIRILNYTRIQASNMGFLVEQLNAKLGATSCFFQRLRCNYFGRIKKINAVDGNRWLVGGFWPKLPKPSHLKFPKNTLIICLKCTPSNILRVPSCKF